MRVLITGATGLVGRTIVKLCHEQGIAVNYLTTRSNKISNDANYKGFLWNPKQNELDVNCFKGVNVIIHLAGASIAKRWTSSYKAEILSSRVDSTQLLIDELAKVEHTVSHVISASAIGIYPDSKTTLYQESSTVKSTTFLGEVVKEWENAVDGFINLGIKVAKVRTGIVLSSKGGALKEMEKPIKLGLGSALGDGEQWQSWIHVQDLAQIFMHIYANSLEGVYNAIAPIPVTNAQLTQAIAKQLSKPLFMPKVPKFAMQLVLGEMHILLFESQKVDAQKIVASGYNFKFKTIESALTDIYS